jgi:hypothetical protein
LFRTFASGGGFLHFPGPPEPNERLIVQVDHLDHIGRDMIAAINLQSHFLIEDRACF